MATERKTAQVDFLGTSAAAALTCASGSTIKITSIDLCNIDNSVIDVSIWLAPNDSGAVRTVSADDRYQRCQLLTPEQGAGINGLEWMLSAENDSIQLAAATASKVSAAINYIEVT